MKRKNTLRRNARIILISFSIFAYVILIFFTEPILERLEFSKAIRREAVLFNMSSFFGVMFFKLSELELIFQPKFKGLWSTRRTSMNFLRRINFRQITIPFVSIVLTLAIVVLQYLTPFTAT